MISIELEGLDELIAKLNGNSLYAGPVKDAFNRSVLHLESQVKERTPVDTGRLRSSVTHAIDSSVIPLWGKVGTNVSYAPMIEFGTKAHVILPRNKKALAFRIGRKGKRIIVMRVNHPGTKAYRMFQNAYRDSLSQIEGFFRRAAQEIESKWGK